MQERSFRQIAWHVLLFISGVILTFFASALPIIVLKPKAYAALGPGEVLAQLAPQTLADLTAPWTTYLFNIVLQILVFRLVRRAPSVVFLIAAAAVWSAYYFWLWSRVG